MTVGFAQGELFAQLNPDVTTAVPLWVNDTGSRVEVTVIIGAVIQSQGSGVDIEIFHDDDGTTYDGTTVISTVTRANIDSDVSFQAQSVGTGIFIKPGGSLGCRVSSANSVNFSVYGVSQSHAERVRGV